MWGTDGYGDPPARVCSHRVRALCVLRPIVCSLRAISVSERSFYLLTIILL